MARLGPEICWLSAAAPVSFGDLTVVLPQVPLALAAVVASPRRDSGKLFKCAFPD